MREVVRLKNLEKCRGTQTRTGDLCVPNTARYQLRHTPNIETPASPCVRPVLEPEAPRMGYLLDAFCVG